MTAQSKYAALVHQLDVLNGLMHQYGGKTLDNVVQNLVALKEELERKNPGIADSKRNDEAIPLDIETQVRLINGHWEDFIKKKKLKFSCEDAEGQCKALFAAGYWHAWNDLSEISSRAKALDELLSKQA